LKDEFVPEEVNVEKLMASMKKAIKKATILLLESNHSLSDKESQDLFMNNTIEFINK
jgi:hypothetical protein